VFGRYLRQYYGVTTIQTATGFREHGVSILEIPAARIRERFMGPIV